MKAKAYQPETLVDFKSIFMGMRRLGTQGDRLVAEIAHYLSCQIDQIKADLSGTSLSQLTNAGEQKPLE